MKLTFVFPNKYNDAEIEIENPFDFLPRKGDFVAGFFDELKCEENNFEVENVMIHYDIKLITVFLKEEEEIE